MHRTLTDWLSSYLKYTEKSESHDLYRAWAGIACIASALQRKCRLYFTPDNIIYPNLFIVLVGPSGARKGTALKPIKLMLDEVGVTLTSTAASLQAIILQMSRTRENASLSSGEQIEHSSITIFSEELTVFLKRQEGELLDVLCHLFDCPDYYEYETVGRGKDEIFKGWLTLIGATTPTLIRESLPRSSIEGGFTSRTLFIYAQDRARRIPIFDISTSSAEEELRKRLVSDLNEIKLLKGDFYANEEYIEAYSYWYRTQNPPENLKENKIFDPYEKRRALHLLKLSMVVSASRSSSMKLELLDFNRALLILESAEAVMHHAFGGYGSSKDAQSIYEMIEFVKAAGKHGVTYEAFARRFIADVSDPYRLSNLLNNLVGTGQIARIDNENGKRLYFKGGEK